MISSLILGWIVFRVRHADIATTTSVRCACRMVYNACVKGRSYGFLAENVRQHMWMPRRAVAHLWAGLRYHQGAGVHPIDTPNGCARGLSICTSPELV